MTDNERKMRELYGQSAHLAAKKGDGSLMTFNADWRNPHQTYTNKKPSEMNVLQDPGYERKHRKAAQL